MWEDLSSVDEPDPEATTTDTDATDAEATTHADVRNMWLRIGAAVAVLIAGVAALAVLAGGRPVKPEAGTFALRPGQSPLEASLAGLQSYAAAARGLDFTAPPTVTLVSTAQLRQLRRQTIDQNNADRAATRRALGLPAVPDEPAGSRLPGGTTLDPAGGYFSFIDHTIYLDKARFAGTPDTAARALLVIELVHALDDQHQSFLTLTRTAGANEDARLALTALIEGDATLFARSYRSTQGPVGVPAPTPSTYSGNLRAFAAESGASFVAAVLDSASSGAAGRSALSAAFAAPPTSTAQVLRPSAYLAGEGGGVSVRDPQNNGTLIDSGSLGQVQLALLVSRGRTYTNVSATGQWRGDRYDTIRRGNRSCVRDTAYLSDSAARDQLAADLRGAGVQVTASPIDASLTLNRCG